jgi:hypothetical protein
MNAKTFPVARYVALAWLLIWIPAYVRWYGPVNFLQLCDITVILTCIGLWTGSPLLLSMQALSSLVIDVAWVVDLIATFLTGRHLVGGTEYMWEERYPLWVRLLSFFHLVWPPLLIWALRRVGYDRRALIAQSALTAVVLVASRCAPAGANANFAYTDPFFGRQWGSAPAHVAVIALVLAVCVYWPTHAALRRWLRPATAEPQ